MIVAGARQTHVTWEYIKRYFPSHLDSSDKDSLLQNPLFPHLLLEYINAKKASTACMQRDAPRKSAASDKGDKVEKQG